MCVRLWCTKLKGIESGVFQFMLSDMIVVWRAWTLCSENRKLMVGPLLTLLGSIGKEFK